VRLLEAVPEYVRSFARLDANAVGSALAAFNDPWPPDSHASWKDRGPVFANCANRTQRQGATGHAHGSRPSNEALEFDEAFPELDARRYRCGQTFLARKYRGQYRKRRRQLVLGRTVEIRDRGPAGPTQPLPTGPWRHVSILVQLPGVLRPLLRPKRPFAVFTRQRGSGVLKLRGKPGNVD
jgi:hypothetical protein